MKRSIHLIVRLTIITFVFASLHSCHLVHKWFNPDEIDAQAVRQLIVNGYGANPDQRPWNQATKQYYSQGGDLIWTTPEGIRRSVMFVKTLQRLSDHGVNPNRLGLQIIIAKYNAWRHADPSEEDKYNSQTAHLEYLLTRAYLHYICGLKYGFVDPARIYNNLYEDLSIYPDSVTPPADRKKKMFRLFDIPLNHANTQFALESIDAFKANPSQVLKEAQPHTLYYQKLQEELKRVQNNKWKSNCVRANLERARWQFKQKFGRKYVYVNTAMYMLKAVDMDRDTLFEMKICCGSFKHKSPMLTSTLTYFELNPSWTVPPKIVKKEFIPAFVRDSNFFARNHLLVFDRHGQQLNARHINWSKFKNSGIPFKIRQESGSNSDLGRIIFRFPNRFSVYLHDTSSRHLFGREERSVSHGCIRLERPLDLAYFLMKYPKEEKMNRIRTTIGMTPVKTQNEDSKDAPEVVNNTQRKFYGFEGVPVFIDYRTIYLATDHNLVYCNDHYKYDPPLIQAIKNIKF